MFDIIFSAVASVLLCVLSLYLLARKKGVQDIALSLVLLLLAMMEVADQLSMNLAGNPVQFKRAAVFLESIFPVVIMYFSLIYSRKNSIKSFPLLWWALMGAGLLFPISVVSLHTVDFFFSPDLQTERILFLENAGYWFYMALMVYCVIALMNLEATFLATKGTDRWRMKYEAVGIGSILAVLIFYYSQGLLYRTINMNLLPVRSGVLILSSVLIGYSKIFRGNGVRVAISRYILYRSVTLLVVGLYLLMLGVVGEGMRYFGVSFSKDVTILIAFATGIAMMLILLSEHLRRRVRLFISKHFYAQKHDYRNEWLKFSGRLSSCKTIVEAQNAIVSTYRETFGLQGAALYLLERDAGKYTRVANQGMPSTSASIHDSAGMILHCAEKKTVFDPFAGKYRLSPEESSFVDETGTRLIVPLSNNGGVKGFIILGDTYVKKDEFTYEDYDLMNTFAKQAIMALLNFRLSEELAEAREIAAVARISSFVIHDLKNQAYSLSLMLENAEHYIHEPEFQSDMISSLNSTVMKMKALMERLKTIPEQNELNIAETDIHLLAGETVDELTKVKPGVEIQHRGTSVVSMVDAEEVRKVIQNLLFNALDATGGNGAIWIETGFSGNMTYMSVGDRGCGMSEEFINESLFKPFRTTKQKGLGIGLYQCKQIIEAHGGSIEVQSEQGKGSVFTVYFPVANSAGYESPVFEQPSR